MFCRYLDAHPLSGMIRHIPSCPFPEMEDRAAWEAIEQEDRADLLALYDAWKDKPYPMCTAAQFMAFVRDGSRSAYETPYFSRRRKLISALLHCCITGTVYALDDVIDGIWCICEESSWVVSAHNINQHDGAPKPSQKPLPDIDDPYVDLFAAQTAMILALTSRMLGRALDSAAPIIRRRISREIERRILIPFQIRDDFWWMGFTRKDLCNWTPWIVSNVLLTASLEMHDAIRFAELADRSCRMLDRWLDVMPQDGGCDEGTAYYNMAGGALLDCMELLERLTDGEMALWHEEKIRDILSFPLKTQLENGWFVNFADCDARPFLCGERLQTAGEKLGISQLVRMGCMLRGTPSQQIGDVPHLTRLLMRLFHPAAQTEAPKRAERDVWMPDLELRVKERDGMILCCKGGHNGESHNHNDVGSFMFYVDGEPQVVDAGNMTYTAKTFSQERYTLFNTRSAYHNLPLIGDAEQLPGKAYRPRDVRRLENGLRLDIAGAYGEKAGVVSCLRSLMLTDVLTLRDCIELKDEKPVTWVFMLRHKPVLEEGALCSGAILLRYAGDMQVKIEELPVTDKRMAANFPGSLWRLMLTVPAAKRHEAVFVMERKQRQMFSMNTV